MSPTLQLATALIARASVTPDDCGCQALIAERLRALDFQIEPLRFEDVDNLWARRGSAAPLFVFAGHTDVVPSGPAEAWLFPPFQPTLHQGFLYGRGAADMKGSIAAMLTACERFIGQHPQHRGAIGFLLTSDEEGAAVNGTVKVIEHLQARQEQIDWCLVGEPSSRLKLGDEIKNGRRGSLTGYLQVQGVQGHVAYPHLADNPIHRFATVLQALCSTEWDQGNDFFPPTGFQVSNIHAGTGATNVIPGSLALVFNFRYSSVLNETVLRERVTALLDKQGFDYNLEWVHSGAPFLTAGGALLDAANAAVQEICGYAPILSTSGGTSDGRFIAPTGAQVIELGPLNATIHKVNECVNSADLDQLSLIYEGILQRLLLPAAVI